MLSSPEQKVELQRTCARGADNRVSPIQDAVGCRLLHNPQCPKSGRRLCAEWKSNVIRMLSQVFQREVDASNQSPVTNSDAVDHLMGGVSYGQRRIVHFASKHDP